MTNKGCKYCGNMSHYSFQCYRRPTKARPMLVTVAKAIKRTPLKRIGKVTKRWMETRLEWIQLHPAPWQCHYCGRELDASSLTLDHLESRSRHPELRYEMSNLVAACSTDNRKKGALSHDEYVHSCH